MTPLHLKQIRQSLGWTLQQMADATTWPKSSCFRYEKGEVPMPDDFKKQLKKAMAKKIIELQKNINLVC